MSATTIIEQAFGPNANLYTAVLQLPHELDVSQITPSQLRKAYYRQALLYHPDKHTHKSPQQKNEAKLKFQAISLAYSILSDPDRKTFYDESGELDDDENGLSSTSTPNEKNFNVWKDYFNGIFGKVTTTDIDKFTESYKCSEEEEKDVLKYYKQFQGDLNKMLECVMCSEEVDKKRWVEDYIQPAIEKHQVPDYMKKVKDTMDHVDNDDDDEEEEDSIDDDDETVTEDESDDKRNDSKRKNMKNQKSKAPPAKKRKATKKKSTEPAVSQDLIAAIRGRAGGGQRGGLDSLLAGLEERYASKKKTKAKNKKKGMVEDIPDEEFEKIQKRLESQRKRKHKV